MSDKTISLNLKYFGENRQKVVHWMKTLLKDIPEKQRGEIEVMFDSYKNYLDADVSYMQNRYVMEGWLFANFIAILEP